MNITLAESDATGYEINPDAPIPFDISEAISLNDARKLMRGRRGRRPSIDTVRRWASLNRGCYPLGPKGPKILLMSIKFNGEVLTHPDWVEAFERRRLQLAFQRNAPPKGTPRTTAQRRRGHAKAMKELRDKGVIDTRSSAAGAEQAEAN
jgi:hypothetical protein